MLDRVKYSNGDGYPSLTLSDGQNHYHIPIQALADRMELYGLESAEQALEYIGLELRNIEVADTLHASIQQAYGEVASAEYAQSLMPSPRFTDQVQTILAPASIGTSRRDTLRERRSENLQVLGMQSVIHSEPMIRVMDETRPMERTRPAAAEALGVSEEDVQEAVRLLQERVDIIQAWRVETACSYVPQLRQKLEQEMEKK